MKSPLHCMISAAALLVAMTTAPAQSACTNTGSFEKWLSDFRSDAKAQGISARAVSALDSVTFDQAVINSDRHQGVFSQGFLEFSDRMVAKYRLEEGTARIAKNRALFDKIEQDYGVPAPVIVAFWGLETDFGSNNGKLSTLRSLATLAYDCRRPEKFRAELFDALRIVERGDMKPDDMRGPWAGEMGQTQFVPSIYYKYGVDFDGDGRRDLIHSTPDVLASTANYLKSLGWERGKPWLREVRVPEEMDWSQSDLSIQLPISEWLKRGVRPAEGEFKDVNAKASLVLPLGRKGPAFLAYQNFQVYLQWNQSLVYSLTAAYYATRLAGAPQVSRGRGVVAFTMDQTRELQKLLHDKGHDIGEIDGKLGSQTRVAVREEQMRLHLPADGYPTEELLQRLRTR